MVRFLILHTTLEVKSHLRRRCSRRHVVRATERRDKVVERYFVRKVDDGQLSAPFAFVAMEEIVVPDREIEQVTVSNPRRILVIIFSSRRRNLDKRRAILRSGAQVSTQT